MNRRSFLSSLLVGAGALAAIGGNFGRRPMALRLPVLGGAKCRNQKHEHGGYLVPREFAHKWQRVG